VNTLKEIIETNVTGYNTNNIDLKPRSTFRANFNAILAVTHKWWLISLQYKISFIFWLIAPILILLPTVIFGTILVGSRYSTNLEQLTGTADIWLFTGLGLAYLRFLFGTMWTSAYAIREEEFHGTLESIYLTPPSKLSIIAGTTLFALTNNGMTLIVQVIFLVWLLGTVKLDQILMAVLFIFSSVLMIQGLAVLLSAMVLRFKQGWRIVFTIEVLISTITPSAFPLAVLPYWLREISLLSPFTIGVIGFRDSLLFGVHSGLWIELVKLYAYFIIFAVLGHKIFISEDRRLRFKGTLGKY
jgi:ABC-2 type transport system permease protein